MGGDGMDAILQVIETYWWLWLSGLGACLLIAIVSWFAIWRSGKFSAIYLMWAISIPAGIFKVLFLIAMAIKILKYCWK